MLQLTTVLFLIASSILAVTHNLALALYLYWRFDWFDIPMHFLGGIVVALGLFTAYDFRIFRSSRFLKMGWVLSFVLAIALIWEAYELLIGIPIMEDYIFDTSLDLIMGLLGGYVGFYVGQKIRKLR